MYEIITPLGTVGGDHVNNIDDESRSTSVKSTGGLPGAVKCNIDNTQ